MSEGDFHPIQLSVALVTRNRPESLRRCLRSLRTQNPQPCEVIVADDSDAIFAPDAAALATAYDCRYVTGPRRGLYANRNCAARACRGTHVRTMDDDHTFPDGHFARCLAAVHSDPRAVWTTGETSYLNGLHYDTATTANQLHPSGVGCAVSNPDDNWAIADGSTIYPREVFARGLWMVEEFAYGSSYLEFGALLHRCGYRSRCIRGALVEHYIDPETIRRQRDPRTAPSRLFASLCYNLCFQPNWLRAGRYALACWRSDPSNRSLLASLPRFIAAARARWSIGATIDAATKIPGLPDQAGSSKLSGRVSAIR